MKDMFQGCSNLTNMNLSLFNFKKYVNIEYMFAGCENLVEVILFSLENQPVNADYIFGGCKRLKKIMTNIPRLPFEIQASHSCIVSYYNNDTYIITQ